MKYKFVDARKPAFELGQFLCDEDGDNWQIVAVRLTTDTVLYELHSPLGRWSIGETELLTVQETVKAEQLDIPF